jgi:hypothetical protein
MAQPDLFAPDAGEELGGVDGPGVASFSTIVSAPSPRPRR